MNYHWNNYIHLGFEEVEQFVLFIGASKIESFMSKNYKTCVACNKLKDMVSSILDYCIENFSNNCYIIDYKERLINAQECIHNLQEPVEEEIAEPESSLDEKEKESDEQRSNNGLATHAYLLMRVTLHLLHYLIVPHAYQRRMNVVFLWILLKYLL